MKTYIYIFLFLLLPAFSFAGETIPDKFALAQNYPNPFNPTTTISYQIPEECHVKLKVFNILGKEVATLVNARKAAGSYTAIFDGKNLPSGVYIYTLQAGSFTQTKRLLLFK